MSNKFDIFVIGTGVAGGNIAISCSKKGSKVGICDYRDYGGTCGLRGCNPKKVLTGCAEAQARVQAYREKGAITGETSINWEKLINFKEKFVKDISDEKENDFSNNNVEMFHGKAEFISRNKLKIGEQTIESDKIIIATGAIPRTMNIPGENYLVTSEEFMSLTTLPKEILFIGGGFISFELAEVANQAGASVTILERSSKPLTKFEPELVNLLTQEFSRNIIKIEKNTAVVSIKKQGDKFQVETETGKLFSADLVVHGAGRVPQIAELKLEKGEVETNKHGIILNKTLQSKSNSSVYVVGDAVSNPDSLPLTPVASLEAKILVHNLLNEDSKEPDYTATASALFTFPPLASVGMLEKEAKEKGIDYSVNFQDTSNELSTQRLGLKISGFKIIVRKDNLQIIGAHLLGHHVDEVINIFAVAIKNGITADKLKETIWSFPSVSDILDEML